MGVETGIEWCDHTFNPWIGCTPISEGCARCYAKTFVENRMGRDFGVLWRTSGPNWRKPLKWNAAAIESGVRRRVFVASLADVFDNQAVEKWRNDLWELISLCPGLDWLLLTKRPQNIAKMLPSQCYHPAWPWPHVWLGTTAENQEEADRRIPHLLAVPASVRFLSCEPLLGPIDLTAIPTRWPGIEDPSLVHLDALRGEHRCGFAMRAAPGRVHWVIAGGESGPLARPTHQAWARDLRDQCAAVRVPFFWKQWGEWLPGCQYTDKLRETDHDVFSKFNSLDWVDGEWHLADPFDSTGDETFRVGKKRAGNLLDGVRHMEFPA